MVWGIRGAIVCIALGFVLLLSSFLWPQLFKDKWVWDDTQAQELSAAAANLHQLTHESAEIQVDERSDAAEKQRAADELAAAQSRYQASRQQLERAQASRQSTAVVLRWLGVALLIIGLLRYTAVREKTGSRK